ncbi:TPA: hypothetical protein ACH3X1_011273 [Trebouxia sp. C0004]
MSESNSVVVVGAGLAGLYAAKLLQPQFKDVLVLEATNRPGGRVRQVAGAAPWPVEAGPQFIHGANSSLKEMLDEMQCGIQQYDWPDWWYFGKERRFMRAPAEDQDLNRTHELFADVGNEKYPETDISAEQWLRNKGASSKVLAIADACYANDFGCTLHQLGLREMITENRKWDSGEDYLVLDCPLSDLVKHIAKDLNRQIHCNCPVSRIEHDSNGALIRLYGGRQIRCKHVLVTVPITVLQREEITFVPPLPQLKQQAIQRVKMSNAIKVIMMFAQPFWPEGFFDVVCTDSFIPEFWVTPPPTYSHQHEKQPDSCRDASQSSASRCGPQAGSSQQAAAQDAGTEARQEHKQNLQQGQTLQPQQQQSWQQPQVQQHDSQQQQHDTQQQQQQEAVYCMVGFVAGSKAEEISKLRQNSVVIKTLSQLDDMFCTKQQLHPATSAFLHAHIVDWSREKHIYGAYTYPTLHAQVGDRDVLAEAIGTTVFFAGEATHAAINPCMQAAMETGSRAAAQILSVQKTVSGVSRL